MLSCFALATWITNPHLTELSSLEEFLTVRIKLINFVLFIGLLLFWHLILNSFSLYTSKRLTNRWKEVFDVIKATLLGSLIIYVAGLLFSVDIITTFFIAVFWISSSTLMILSRLIQHPN